MAQAIKQGMGVGILIEVEFQGAQAGGEGRLS
jgi:hypothetical protein